jgi:hypothetical protein
MYVNVLVWKEGINAMQSMGQSSAFQNTGVPFIEWRQVVVVVIVIVNTVPARKYIAGRSFQIHSSVRGFLLQAFFAA